MTAQIWIAVVVGCAAIVDDLARRRVSNWIPLAALVSGLALQSVEKGWQGTVYAFLGACTGAAAFLIFYLMGGLGGGDIKLISGFGAVLGPSQVLVAALWAAACGGIIAAAVMGVSAMRRCWRNHRNNITDSGPKPLKQIDSIPYAPAIALGAWLSLASKASGIAG
ncbi:MAG: A24 family peptidase [Bryobacteraceae bacterium]